MQSFIKYPTDSERFNPDPPFYRKKKYTYITFYQIKIADKSKSKQKLLFSKEKKSHQLIRTTYFATIKNNWKGVSPD